MRLSGGARAATVLGGSNPLGIIRALSPVLFYVSSPQYLFQGSTGSGDVTADSTAVGYTTDLSGSGNHCTQDTAGSKPLFKTSAGINWLEFDGSDDWMRATFAINQPWVRISAIRQTAWVSGDRIFGPAATNDRGFLFQTNSSPNLSLYDGAIAAENTEAAIDADVVITEIHNGASSKLAVDSAAYTTGDVGANNNDGLTLAGDIDSPAAAGGFRLHGMVMFNRLITDADIATCRTFLAKLQGRSL